MMMKLSLCISTLLLGPWTTAFQQLHCVASGKVSRTAHSINQETYDTNDDDFLEEDGPKAQLLDAIGWSAGLSGATKFGFGATSKDTVVKLVEDLSGYVLPLDKPSEWKLLYSTSPDVLGFQGGPLSQLVGIRNIVRTSSQMEILLEYQPSANIVQMTSSFLSDIQDDRLEQAILFDYQVGSMNKVDLQLKGTRIEGSRFGNLPSLESPAALPFIGFSIVFNDGDLRVDRSIQGDFLFIYKRIS